MESFLYDGFPDRLRRADPAYPRAGPTPPEEPMTQRTRGKTSRLSLDLDDSFQAALERVAANLNTRSKSEALRRAITLMDITLNARKEGHAVGIASSSESLDTEFVLI